jgi:hypothetical protein
MDKVSQIRGADTNMLEIKKIVDCLLKNGYEFEGTREVYHPRLTYPDEAVADFLKKIEYTNADGEFINDSEIKVSIQFEKRADYTNFIKDENEDNIYNGDTDAFIIDLIEEIEDSKNSVKNGGKKRCKNGGKKRKTTKNYKKLQKLKKTSKSLRLHN